MTPERIAELRTYLAGDTGATRSLKDHRVGSNADLRLSELRWLLDRAVCAAELERLGDALVCELHAADSGGSNAEIAWHAARELKRRAGS